MKIKLLVGLVLIVLIAGGIIIFIRSRSKTAEVGTPAITQQPSTDTAKTGTDGAATTTKKEPYFGEFLHDQDRDGLTDEKEKELGLSDQTSDSDKDGLDDSTEIEIYKTDPKNKDTDGDGFVDGYEVLNGFNPNGPGKLTQ